VADEKHAFGNARPDRGELRGVAEKLDDLADLLLHGVVAGDVGEGGVGAFRAPNPRPAARERADAGELAAGPPRQPQPDADEQRERQEVGEDAGDRAGVVGGVVAVDAMRVQQGDVGVGRPARGALHRDVLAGG